MASKKQKKIIFSIGFLATGIVTATSIAIPISVRNNNNNNNSLNLASTSGTGISEGTGIVPADETIQQYKNKLIALFNDKYTYKYGQNIVNTSTISATKAAAEQLITVAIYNRGSLGSIANISIPNVPASPLASYKIKLKQLFSNKFTDNNGQNPVNTTTIDQAKTEADAKTAATTLAANIFIAPTKAQTGVQATINVPSVPTNDSLSAGALNTYKNTLTALFTEKFADAANFGAVDTTTIDQATTASAAKSAADSITAYDPKAIVPGVNATINVPNAPNVLTTYKNTLVRLFADKFTDATNTTAVNKTSINNATTTAAAKSAAEALVNASVYDHKAVEAAQASVITIPDPQ